MDIPRPPTPPNDAPGASATAPPPRHLAAGEGIAWWGESWRIFLAAPGPWIGIIVVFIALSFAFTLLPKIGAVAYGILTPVFVGGVMLGCHALARGEPLRLGCIFEGFQHGHFAPLCTLGLLWLAVLVVLACVAVGTILLAVGASGLAALVALVNSAQADPFVATHVDYAVLASASIAIMVVSLFAVVVMLLAAMAYWFAPALVVLDGEQPLAALQKSFAASWQNVGAFLLYGLVYIGLAIVATIPLGLGWLALGPMILGSCYAGWRTIFGR